MIHKLIKHQWVIAVVFLASSFLLPILSQQKVFAADPPDCDYSYTTDGKSIKRKNCASGSGLSNATFKRGAGDPPRGDLYYTHDDGSCRVNIIIMDDTKPEEGQLMGQVPSGSGCASFTTWPITISQALVTAPQGVLYDSLESLINEHCADMIKAGMGDQCIGKYHDMIDTCEKRASNAIKSTDKDKNETFRRLFSKCMFNQSDGRLSEKDVYDALPDNVYDTMADVQAANTTSERDNKCEDNNGALAWFGCGLLAALDGVINFLDGQINGLLFVDTAELDGAGLKNSWAVMRNVAYMILIPMMLVMVIGTAVGFGPFDPYTVKKALPRMVIAVIFISVSYYVCKFAVDLSNTVGVGISNLISLTTPGGEVNSLSDIVGGGFASLAAGGVVVYGLVGSVTWMVSLSFALTALASLLIGYVVLILRQVLIVMLIVLAPLAILVWIFPGNDKLWKIWRTTLTAMLLMFPIIMILIVSGRFFAGVTSQMDITGGTFIMLVAYIAPFFFIPATFKWGLGVFGNLAGVINDKSRGLFDRQKKFREESRGKARERARAGNRFQGGNDRNFRGMFNRGLAGTMNAPGAILDSGSLTSPGNWRAVTRTAVQARHQAEIERNMKENGAYAPWMYDDGLNRSASESNNEAELRRNLVNSKYAEEGSRELEDAVARVETVRRSMSPEAFRAMTSRQAIAGGTAFKSKEGAPKTAAGEVWASVARAAGNDDAMAQYLVANGRSEGMKAGRVDYAGAGFGTTLGVVNEMRDELRRTGGISQATIEKATKTIHADVYQAQGGGTLVHSSMKPSATEELAPEMVRTVDDALISKDSRKISQEFASLSAVYEGMRGSNPQKAKLMADRVLSQKVDIASLPPDIKESLGTALRQPDGSYKFNGEISYQQMIDGLQGNAAFKEMVKTYESDYARQRGELPPEPGMNPGEMR